jgi:hypothetical protein
MSVVVVRSVGQRIVRARFTVNQTAASRAQVKRGGHVLSSRVVRLTRGNNTLQLFLRRTVTAGRAWFAITIRTNSSQVTSLRKRIVIPRK